MKAVILLALMAFSEGGKLPARSAEVLSGEALVHYLNTNQKHFKAKQYDFSSKRGMDRKFIVPRAETPIAAEISHILDQDIPESFDAREHWYYCPSIGAVRDQAQCASCWAHGAAEIISDRVCITSKGQKQPVISVEDILACCQAWDKDCGGCDGGYPDRALNFYNAKGVVSGGGFDSKVGCAPYAFSPCGHHNGMYYGKCPSEVDTPECSLSCEANFTTAYEDDKHYGQPGYRIWSNNVVASIQKELMTNGPIMDCFDMYSDLWNYESGIYVQTAGYYVGGHCVKLIGWGVENGTPYWTVANSWNTDWGENGYFRIIRGLNECAFEEFLYASIPK